MLTVGDIAGSIKSGNFVDLYPESKFLESHLKIISPFEKAISKYKREGYKRINSYYRTYKKVSTPALLKVITTLESIYNLLEPLDNDIIIYRGIKTGFIGNDIEGNYIKSEKYHMITKENEKFHRYDKIPTNNFQQVKLEEEGYEKSSIIQTLGFCSFSTDFNIAKQFANISGSNYDTVLALKLRKGTKCLLPVNGYSDDNEKEIILFPSDNQFILRNKIIFDGITIYTGEVINS